MQKVFEIVAEDKRTRARAGLLHTNHGVIRTPQFCPVGTSATVKTLAAPDLEDADIILNNAYHLYLRPGMDVLKKMGGLHTFQSWEKPIITDSGGFQVFSLSGLTKVTEDGVKFQSPFDGSYHFIGPEDIVDIQTAMDSDIMMCLDECIPYPSPKSDTKRALALTLRWEKRALEHWRTLDRSGLLYGIIQGGFFEDLRRESTERIIEMDFPGIALGGLSVGEPKNMLYDMVDVSTEMIPHQKPRHLLGVGTPLDILRGVELGIDHFDCVMPTRNARNGSVFTWKGKFTAKAGAYKDDTKPIDENCGCYTCRNFSRGYIRHLFNSGELLAPRLATIHSVYFYLEFMREIRKSIIEDRFDRFARNFRADYSETPLTPEIK